jgi:hypothetical protein
LIGSAQTIRIKRRHPDFLFAIPPGYPQDLFMRRNVAFSYGSF